MGSEQVYSDCYSIRARFEEVGYKVVYQGKFFHDCLSYLLIPHEIAHYEIVKKLARFFYEQVCLKNDAYTIELSAQDDHDYRVIRGMDMGNVYRNRKSEYRKKDANYFNPDPIEREIETYRLENRPFDRFIQVIDFMENFGFTEDEAVAFAREAHSRYGYGVDIGGDIIFLQEELDLLKGLLDE